MQYFHSPPLRHAAAAVAENPSHLFVVLLSSCLLHHFTTKVPLRPQTVRTLAIVAAAVVVLWVILGASGVMLRMMISVWG